MQGALRDMVDDQRDGIKTQGDFDVGPEVPVASATSNVRLRDLAHHKVPNQCI